MAAEHENGPPSSISHSAPLLLAGPTAVGKSEIAELLAERLGGEIISVDSMQVYHGMDIGTAKPSPGERARVPHHLIDVLDLPESFDAAQFLQLARRAVSDIQARGRVPILCGGAGLYFKVFLDGLGQTPPADAALRAILQATPLPELLRELAERDPAAYERIDRQNPRRVIRAMEVIRLTGQPFSSQRVNWQPSPLAPRPSSLQFGLARAPADLQRRIDARVDAMFRLGWVAETEQLLRRGLAQNQTAMQALGYRQIVEHLRGQRSLAETIALVKIRTRQFAKRQMTWFRRQLHLTWVHLEAQSSPEAVVRTIAAH
jgi:tRNA dimethylallyltransferase